MGELARLKNVKKLRELTGVGMLEGFELMEQFDGDISKVIEHLRSTGDEPDKQGLTDEMWVITHHDGSESVFDDFEIFQENYHGCRGDGAVYISPVGRYSYYK